MPYHRAPILFIDDDATLRELVVEALACDGYDALAVASHAEAARALACRPYALILSDTAGPWTPDPWAALESVRAAASGTPVVIFSARPADIFIGYAARGFAGHIAKPFNLDDLLGMVRDILAPV